MTGVHCHACLRDPVSFAADNCRDPLCTSLRNSGSLCLCLSVTFECKLHIAFFLYLPIVLLVFALSFPYMVRIDFASQNFFAVFDQLVLTPCWSKCPHGQLCHQLLSALLVQSRRHISFWNPGLLHHFDDFWDVLVQHELSYPLMGIDWTLHFCLSSLGSSMVLASVRSYKEIGLYLVPASPAMASKRCMPLSLNLNFILCLWVLFMCTCGPCGCGAQGSQKKTSDALGLEFLMVMNFIVYSGMWTWVLWKSN